MLDLKVKVENTTAKVAKAADKAAFKNFGHAGASIMKDAKASIEATDGPSMPGMPPHTHKGQFIKRAIRYSADEHGVVIGTAASIIGQAGAPHEHGGEFHGQDYDERPFMEPALERGESRIGGDWAGSIGE